MSVRQNSSKIASNTADAVMDNLVQETQGVDATLGEGAGYAVSSPDHPLKRNIVVSIKASLNDLCLQKQRGTWAPSAEALRAIFQQKKFTTLEGAAEPQGDLKSVVMHSLKVTHARSSFPVCKRHKLQPIATFLGRFAFQLMFVVCFAALGTRISGVDDYTYSSTGEAFSAIMLPGSESTRDRELQADDVSLGTWTSCPNDAVSFLPRCAHHASLLLAAYEFARKFPGYTADNLSDKGVHEVSARRFVLVAADHPIVSAIYENAEKLQSA